MAEISEPHPRLEFFKEKIIQFGKFHHKLKAKFFLKKASNRLKVKKFSGKAGKEIRSLD